MRESAIGFAAKEQPGQAAKDILSLSQTRDFIEFGFEPEFIGRLPVRVVCHPLAVPYAFAPNMRIDLPPANGVLKTTARFNVIVVPVPVTVVGPSWMMH